MADLVFTVAVSSCTLPLVVQCAMEGSYYKICAGICADAWRVLYCCDGFSAMYSPNAPPPAISYIPRSRGGLS